MNPSYLVFAPVRFSALSFLRPLALIIFSISLCLSALPAQAGTWSLTTTQFTWTHTFDGKNFGPAPRGSGATVYVGGGLSGTANIADATEELQITGTWSPDPSLASDPVPSSVIVKISTTAQSYMIANGVVQAGTQADDGWGDPIDPNSGIASGTHYRVETGRIFTENLSLHSFCSNSNGFAYASVGGVSVSIVNGNWAGPYYFHHGQYTTLGARNGGYGAVTTPWPNNTAGDIPTIEDSPDSTYYFTLSDSGSGNSETEGYITPVWYWTGPDLGVPPPPFEIDLEAEAYSVDSANSYDSGIADDGLGDPDTSIPGGARSSGSASVAATIQSDEYAPGEGNGYWAIGPTIHLKSTLNAPANESAPYAVDTSVSLSASIESGLNN